MLVLEKIIARYGAIEALSGIDLRVEKGEIVTLIGSNGAGKSTTLKAITGLIPCFSGQVIFEGKAISRMQTHRITALGISLVPEGRAVFANLSVAENLRMGAYLQSNRRFFSQDLEHVFELFPRLKERFSQSAGTLSGGEQQMLAIGRALMARPRLLLLDEPSLGIAPLLVKSIYQAIEAINREGTTILLVEQNANAALRHSHRAYVLETGRILMEGKSADLASDKKVREAYLGEM